MRIITFYNNSQDLLSHNAARPALCKQCTVSNQVHTTLDKVRLVLATHTRASRAALRLRRVTCAPRGAPAATAAASARGAAHAQCSPPPTIFRFLTLLSQAARGELSLSGETAWTRGLPGTCKVQRKSRVLERVRSPLTRSPRRPRHGPSSVMNILKAGSPLAAARRSLSYSFIYLFTPLRNVRRRLILLAIKNIQIAKTPTLQRPESASRGGPPATLRLFLI
ncbi:unnamed protein product, partial [Brenthis ino]